MKKRLLIYVTLFAVVFACSDDFSQVPAIGALSDQTLLNETGVDLLLVGAYSTLDGMRNNQPGSDWAGSGDNWWLDAISDDAHKGSTDGDQADLFLLEIYDWTAANPYLFMWDSRYAGVNRANAVIDLINKIPEDEGDFSSQLAEARFLRGHYNFELQKMFGNVSYISEVDFANLEFNKPNDGPIWTEIEADLQYAVDNLPDSQAEVGRPNSWAAKAFLAKAHLFQQDYAAASPLFTDVINNGPYSLNPEFLANFSLAGENSSEAVFTIQFATAGSIAWNGNQGGTLNFPNALGFCCGFYQPTQDLVNAYQTDAVTGLPLLDTFNATDVTNDQELTSADPFTPHTGPLDPRLDYTAGRRGLDYNGYGLNPGQDWVRATDADISGPYLPKKNVYQAGDDGNFGTGPWGQQFSGVNYHIMRYADVLLMAAEVAVEQNDIPTALNYVNEVRNRAKNMSYLQDPGGGDAANYVIEPYTAFADQAEARKAVRFERRLELAMEGHRLFDLRRWGVAESVINTYVTNESRTIPNFGTKANSYMPNMDLLPIPINAIDLSGGVLTQNPGF